MDDEGRRQVHRVVLFVIVVSICRSMSSALCGTVSLVNSGCSGAGNRSSSASSALAPAEVSRCMSGIRRRRTEVMTPSMSRIGGSGSFDAPSTSLSQSIWQPLGIGTRHQKPGPWIGAAGVALLAALLGALPRASRALPSPASEIGAVEVAPRLAAISA